MEKNIYTQTNSHAPTKPQSYTFIPKFPLTTDTQTHTPVDLTPTHTHTHAFMPTHLN